MPHIVLDKKLDLFDFSILFKPIFQKSPLIKIHEMYTNVAGTNSLFSTVVIDSSHRDYFIQIMSSKDRTTIRLFPGTDPEKTDGVKTSMALLAKQIMSHYPEFEVTKTNLSDYLDVVIKN